MTPYKREIGHLSSSMLVYNSSYLPEDAFKIFVSHKMSQNRKEQRKSREHRLQILLRKLDSVLAGSDHMIRVKFTADKAMCAGKLNILLNGANYPLRDNFYFEKFLHG